MKITRGDKRQAVCGEKITCGKAESATAVDNGYVEGYAATWGVDMLGERFQKGAFAKSVAEAVPAGKVKLMVRHMRDGGDVYETVGVITEAKEDDYGLFIKAEFGSDDDSQKMRGKVVENLVSSFSVGYVLVNWVDETHESIEGSFVRPVITEAKLLEVTLTNVPVNEGAIITGAKSVSTDVAVPADVDTTETPEVETPVAVPRVDVDTRRRRLRLLSL